MMMLDRVRTAAHRLITTSTGDSLLLVRLPKDLARRANMTLGEPLCSAEEVLRRQRGREQLAKLRTGDAQFATNAPSRVAAPVIVYFEKDRNTRLLERIRETLNARGIAFTELDVTHDEVAKATAVREAKCKEDELPLVFVATTPVGGYNDLVEWDVAGKLERAVYGTAANL